MSCDALLGMSLLHLDVPGWPRHSLHFDRPRACATPGVAVTCFRWAARTDPAVRMTLVFRQPRLVRTFTPGKYRDREMDCCTIDNFSQRSDLARAVCVLQGDRVLSTDSLAQRQRRHGQ